MQIFLYSKHYTSHHCLTVLIWAPNNLNSKKEKMNCEFIYFFERRSYNMTQAHSLSASCTTMSSLKFAFFFLIENHQFLK